MKLALQILFLLVSSPLVHAQSRHFIFLQSEADQSFFVKQQERTMASGSSGFVLLSELPDSAQLIRIGFPDNKYPEQQFRVPFNGSDRGFMVRLNPAGNWVLYDLQSAEVVPAVAAPGRFRMEPRQATRFTTTLAKASGDPTLLYDLVRIEPEKPAVAGSSAAIVQSNPAKSDTVMNNLENDSLAMARAAVDTNFGIAGGSMPVAEPQIMLIAPPRDTVQQQLADSVTQKPPVDTAVSRPSQRSDQVTETVRNDQAVQSAKDPEPVKPGDRAFEVQPATGDTTSFKRSTVTRRSESSTTAGFGLTFTDQQGEATDTIRILIPRDTNGVRLAGQEDAAVAPKPEVRPVDCDKVADQQAVNKLRKRMQKAADEDAMLQETGRFIRATCLTTTQVRDLGRMFLGDGGRFKLYELVYPKIADPNRFGALNAELKDPFFQDKFRGLMH